MPSSHAEREEGTAISHFLTTFITTSKVGVSVPPIEPSSS